MVLDELDDYADVGEGDVVSLASRAARNSPFRLTIAGSSPTAKSTSLIHRAVGQCDLVLDWHVPCPECGTPSIPRWASIRFDKDGDDIDRADSARMLCESCGALWEHRQLAQVSQDGFFGDGDVRVQGDRLVAQNGSETRYPPRLGLRINAISSPFVPWRDMVLAWLDAQGDVLKLQAFTNHWLGEVWQDEDIALDESAVEKQVVEVAAGELPEGVLTIVAAVDVQDGWLSCLTVGFGLGEEAWVLDRREFHGDVSYSEGIGWHKLREWLRESPAWGTLGIDAVVLDSGYETSTVYEVAAGTLPHKRVYATKGVGGWTRPALKTPSSRIRVQSGGSIRLWTIGTDQSKTRIAHRLQSGGIHFVEGLPDVVYGEVTSETLVTRRRAGKVTRAWRLKPNKKRNEALDCLSMAWAGLSILRPGWLSTAESRKAARKFVKEQAVAAKESKAKKRDPAKPHDAHRQLVRERRKRRRSARERARDWL